MESLTRKGSQVERGTKTDKREKRHWDVIAIVKGVCTGCSTGPNGKGVNSGIVDTFEHVELGSRSDCTSMGCLNH